jgi:NADH:ubiquinone oxidoreductase subunit D
MTDEDFLLHIGGLIKDVADNTADRVNSIMEQIADRLNEMESRAITPEYIARLEKRIYDLENK